MFVSDVDLAPVRHFFPPSLQDEEGAEGSVAPTLNGQSSSQTDGQAGGDRGRWKQRLLADEVGHFKNEASREPWCRQRKMYFFTLILL